MSIILRALHGVASEHDIGYAAGWRACADEATRIVALARAEKKEHAEWPRLNSSHNPPIKEPK